MPNPSPIERVDRHALSRVCRRDTENVRPLFIDSADALMSAMAAATGLRGTVHVGAIRSGVWQEELAILEEPTCVAAFLSDQECSALLSLSRDLAHRLVEELLGARTRGNAAVERELTSIDKVLLSPLLDAISARLSTTLDTGQERLSTTGLLTRRTELPGPTSREPTLSAVLEITLEERSQTAVLVLATRLVARKGEPAPALPATPEQKLRTLRILSRSQVAFEAQLLGPTIRMSELAKLQPGDVLTLSVPAGRPVTGVCNGFAAYSGDVLAKGQRNQRVFRVRSAASDLAR
jgi:flagellar motor switch protein FliM